MAWARPNRGQIKSGEYELHLCTAYLDRKDGCGRGETCNCLHICRDYILKQCRAGGQCPFEHNLQSSQSQALFRRRFGINRLEGKKLQEFKELFAATIRNPPQDESLQGSVRQQSEENKQPNQDELKNFLQRFNDTDDHAVSQNLYDLWSMQDIIRALSDFRTEWLWYWCDERGIWRIYSEKNAQGIPADINSATIEQRYHEFKHGRGEAEVSFKAGGQEYRLDFRAMQQINVKYNTCKPVQRRLELVPTTDHHQVSRELSQDQRRAAVQVPTTWGSGEGDQTDMRLRLPLTDHTSSEYSAIANSFWSTMDRRISIISIDRIQNLDLWEDFSKMKERMRRNNGGDHVLQMQLFHGTTKKIARAICRQNFDWRLNGIRVGTLYGKGSYFARYASYAHGYTELDGNNHRCVFVAQVLVGTYTVGESHYTRPPPRKKKNPHGKLYDSCVDDVEDPDIFVIFEKSQMYPEYLITYKY